MNTPNITQNIQRKHQGSVLILALILLIMLTLMAVTEMSIHTVETRVATNSADQQIAFQTAEGAINEATTNLLSGQYSSTSFLNNTNGLYLFNPDNAPLWTTIDWTSSSATIKSFKGSSNTPAAYIIEQLPSIIQGGQNINSPAQVFRITARGVGASGNAVVILQTTVQIQQ